MGPITSFLSGYVAGKALDKALAHFHGAGLFKELDSCIMTWSQSLPQEKGISVSNSLFPTQISDMELDARPALRLLRSQFKKYISPSKLEWGNALVEQWDYVVRTIEGPVPFFTIERSEADELLNELSSLLVEVCEKNKLLFNATVVKKINKIALDSEAIAKHLGLIEQGDIKPVLEKIINAGKEDISKFKCLAGWPVYPLELSFTIRDKEKETKADIQGLSDLLITSYEMSTLSPPGYGKTTSLIQLTEHLLIKGISAAVYIPLSEWSESSETLINSVIRRPSYQGMSEFDFNLLSQKGCLTLLLDGWNEVDSATKKRFIIEKKRLKREFPHLRFVISSRQRELDTPIIGPTVTVEPLSEGKQVELARVLRGDDGVEIVEHALLTKGLSDLVGIPLYLTALLKNADGGSLPETKEELLRLFVQEHELDSEKAESLRSSLSGYHRELLVALAVYATDVDKTYITQTIASSVIKDTCDQLSSVLRGIQPVIVIDTLVDAHLLVRPGWKTSSISFQHQQFQEWFASFYVEDLIEKSWKGHEDASSSLKNDILDMPVWEEAILFACERLSRCEKKVDALAHAIHEALIIDPLLAAEMIFRSTDHVWNKVSVGVIDFIEKWHAKGTVDRAFTFMINCGRNEFSHHIWPLLSSDDNQVSLKANRASKRFRIGVLGPDIQTQLTSNAPSVQELILSELAHECEREELDIVVDLALSIDNPNIHAKVIRALQFRHASKQANRMVLEVADDAIWFIANQNDTYGLTDPEAIKRVKDQMALMNSEDMSSNDVLRTLAGREQCRTSDEVIGILSNVDYSDRNTIDMHLFHRVAGNFPVEIVQVIINKLESGEDLPFRADEFLSQSDICFEEGAIVDHFMQYDPSDSVGDAVASIVGVEPIKRLCEKFILLDKGIKASTEPITEFQRNEYWAIKKRIWKTSEPRFIESIKTLSETDDVRTIAIYSELLADHSPGDKKAVYENYDDLVPTVKHWCEVILNSESASRPEMGELAQVIKRVPSKQLFTLLSKLHAEDLLIQTIEMEEFIKGLKRGVNIQNGARVCYAWNYRDAFAAIGSPQVVKSLKALLDNHEFGEHAAQALKMIWAKSIPKAVSKSDNWRVPKFEGTKVKIEKRLGNVKIDTTGSYADDIINVIEGILEGGVDEKSKLHALKLACAAFSMPFKGHQTLIQQLLALQDASYQLGTKQALFYQLARSGYLLPADLMQKCIEEHIEEAKEKTWLMEHWRIQGWLELFPFSDNPEQLFTIMDGLDGWLTEPNKLDDVLAALKEVPVETGEHLLFEFVNWDKRFLHEYSWRNALIHTGTLNCARYLLKKIEEGAFEDSKGSTHDLTQNLLHFAFKNEKFIDDMVECYPKLEAPVAKHIVGHALSEKPSLDIIKVEFDKSVAEEKAFSQTGLHSMIRNLLIGREESDSFKGAFELFGQPSAELRSWLLPMTQVGNEVISNLAIEALKIIDSLRDEYGSPQSDPRHPDLSSGLPWPIVS